MPLAKDQHMIQTLPAECTDEPFDVRFRQGDLGAVGLSISSRRRDLNRFEIRAASR